MDDANYKPVLAAASESSSPSCNTLNDWKSDMFSERRAGVSVVGGSESTDRRLTLFMFRQWQGCDYKTENNFYDFVYVPIDLWSTGARQAKGDHH